MKKSAKMGHLYKVANTRKKSTANAWYYAVKLEDADTGEEFWAMFTECQWVSFTAFWAPKKYWLREALGKLGQFRKMPRNGKNGIIVTIDVSHVKKDGQALIVQITESALLKARARAEKNPEDIPYQSKLADLLD